MRIVFAKQIISAVILTTIYCEATVAQLGIPLIASSADEWGSRDVDGKRSYLEGYCYGAATTDTGRLNCGDEPSQMNWKTSRAFCSQIYPPFGKLPGGTGLAFIDAFYKIQTHSDIPFWGAVRAFNDKACSENRVTSNLSKIQQKFLCFRQASDMLAMGVHVDVLKIQNEKCSKYP